MPPVRPCSRGGGCVMTGCDSHVFNKDMKRSLIHFFPFPTDPNLRDRWCEKIRKGQGDKGFSVSKYSQVCHLHFKAEDIRKTLTGIWKLKTGAEPACFPSETTAQRRHSTCNTETKDKMSSSPKILLAADTERASILAILKEREALIEELKAENQHLMAATNDLVDNIGRMQREVELVHTKREPNWFASTVESSDSLTEHYTGFSSFSLLQDLLSYLNPGDHCENLISFLENPPNATTENQATSLHQPPKDMDHDYSGSSSEWQHLDSTQADMEHNYSVSHMSFPKYGRRGCLFGGLSVKEQFILVLCRLWLGFSAKHLGHLFAISELNVNQYFLTWMNFMFCRLKPLPIWLSKDDVTKATPKAFGEKYPGTRVIIDCVEILAQAPPIVEQQYTTQVFKGLLGVAPNGTVTFLSNLYAGYISDKQILLRSSFLDQKMFNKDDVILADRGLPISDLLRLTGVKVKLNCTYSFTKRREWGDTCKSNRFQIEQAFSRAKQFRIFDRALPVSLHSHINQIWAVCGILTNYLQASAQ